MKTDRRDAEHLVRLLLAGKLHPVRVPGDEEEALRDLVRARDAVRMDLMRSRHQSEQSAEQHAREILALTKLNWNNSRLDGREPITMRAARSIGTILRHVPDDGTVGARYAFYM